MTRAVRRRAARGHHARRRARLARRARAQARVVLAPKRRGGQGGARVRTRGGRCRARRACTRSTCCASRLAGRGRPRASSRERRARRARAEERERRRRLDVPDADGDRAVDASAKIPRPRGCSTPSRSTPGCAQGELWGLRLGDVRARRPAPELTSALAPRADEGRQGPRDPAARARARGARARGSRAPGDERGARVPDRDRVPTAEERRRGLGHAQGPRRFRASGTRTLAGIARRVRFHDLRHTCASHLIMGTWGAPWSLAEVCAFLRHSSITVTQRYAHLSPEHLHNKAAPRGTARARRPRRPPPGHARVTSPGSRRAVPGKPSDSLACPARTRTRDIRLRRPHVSVEMAEGYALA
jgi:integrase